MENKESVASSPNLTGGCTNYLIPPINYYPCHCCCPTCGKPYYPQYPNYPWYPNPFYWNQWQSGATINSNTAQARSL